ncbi:MAG: ThiF family adenylyltransferase [Armatimonadetes bacterium]|nr:ThiF family adenylyltransferase [Armatimonadota bacterium]
MSAHAVVIGAGRIGSYLGDQPARLTAVGRLTIVDPDAYEPHNLEGQNVTRAALGRAKARVQAAHARAVRPVLEVEALVAAVEDLPQGALRCDLLFTTVDNRLARQWVNCHLAWRLGLRWIDAGIRGSLARVTVFGPAQPGMPCYLCGWSEQHYRTASEALYPCALQRPAGASQAEVGHGMGALAAALQAVEGARMLAGDLSRAGREILFDAEQGTAQVVALTHNPQCRFDHRAYWPEPLDWRGGRLTLAELAGAGGEVRCEGHRFVTRLACPGCGRERQGLWLMGRVTRVASTCRACGQWLEVRGEWVRERVPADGRTVRSVGLRPGDLLGVGGAWLELVAIRAADPCPLLAKEGAGGGPVRSRARDMACGMGGNLPLPPRRQGGGC